MGQLIASGPCSRPGPTSTQAENDTGRYELKFVLPHWAADQILDLARMSLDPDPHADHVLHDGYCVNSLYFDTQNLAVFHHMPSYRTRKFRLRRYGAEPNIYLERKSKSKGVVRKRRTTIHEAELANLERSPNEEPSWAGNWFHARLVQRGLRPMCQIRYDRLARVGMTAEGPIRFTIDRNLVCRPVDGAFLPRLTDGRRMLAGMSIVEFKFPVTLPSVFKAWIREFGLSPARISKYRLSVGALGLASSGGCEARLPGQVGAHPTEACAALQQASA